MLKKSRLSYLLSLLFILFTINSFAVERLNPNVSGPYVRASAGYAILNYVPNSVIVGQSADTQKQSGGIGQLGTGYSFALRDRLAVGAEASFTNYPDLNYTAPDGDGGMVNVKAQSYSFNLLGVVQYFINNFSFAAKAGPAFLISKISASYSADPEFAKFAKGTFGNIGLMTEVGLAYHFEPGLSFTLDFQYSFQKISALGQSEKFNPYGVLAGFSYNFGEPK